MQCYVCKTTHSLAGGLWSTAHEAVAICQHCGAGVCGEHAQRAEAPGSPISCGACFALANAAAPVAVAPSAKDVMASRPVGLVAGAA